MPASAGASRTCFSFSLIALEVGRLKFTCSNLLSWYYKYNYPPLLEDLVKYIPSFNTTLIENKKFDPIHEYTQLSYVLPKKSLYLLPKKIHNFLLNNYDHLYGEDFKIVWHFCRYFWESHVELPHIDIDKLNMSIKSQL